MDLKLNEQEQEQSRMPTLAMQKAIIYTNDLFSWAKEKAEQEEVAASKQMFSAVTVLMTEHKISEAEALGILREKTIECEKEHFAAVSELELAGPVSENLSRYLDMTRLCHSGGMLWSALTDRYNRPSPAQTNGEIKMNGEAKTNGPTSLVSPAVKKPAPNGVIKTNGHVATDGVLLMEDKASSGTGLKHQLDGSKKTEETEVTLKENAKDVGTPPAPI